MILDNRTHDEQDREIPSLMELTRESAAWTRVVPGCAAGGAALWAGSRGRLAATVGTRGGRTNAGSLVTGRHGP